MEQLSKLWSITFGNGYKNMITTQSSIYDPKENKARILVSKILYLLDPHLRQILLF